MRTKIVQYSSMSPNSQSLGETQQRTEYVHSHGADNYLENIYNTFQLGPIL